jgi:hypothetical protein
LPSPDPESTATRRSLDLRLAETNVRVEAPESVLAVLDSTLLFVPRFALTSEANVVISVLPKNDAWEIHGHAGAFKVLGTQSALPQVAGAVVSSAVNDVAAMRDCLPMRASVIQKEGRALALVGDDWESAVTLAAHLHGRGWSYVGSDNVLFDPASHTVYPVQKSLYVNSSSVAQLPMEYRRAVEASPWYVTPQGISFYAVDPRSAGYRQTWAAPTLLHGVVVIDGEMLDRPTLESVEPRVLHSHRFERLGIDWERVGVVDLCLGAFVDSCDLVEHWFESIRF